MLNNTIVDSKFIEDMKVFKNYDAHKGLLEQCSGSVVLFAEKMLGITLYSWQVYFLQKIQAAMLDKSLSREYLALTSRQVGKSTAVAILCIWSAVFNKYPGSIHNNTMVGVISASDVQSKKLLYDMKKLLMSGDRVMQQYKDEKGQFLFGKDFFTSLLSKEEPNNTTTITFMPYLDTRHGKYVLKDSKHGSVIKSYPPTSGVLGETFTVVIEDEAGKTDKISDEFHYDFVYPTGNSTNAIRIYTSTPWTPSGFFYRLADPFDEYGENPCCRVLFTIDSIREENPEYYEAVIKTINQMNADGKISEVRRAYYCEFVKGERNYFDPDKVLNVFSDSIGMQHEWATACDMGVDFGGEVTSRTVITISYLNEDAEIVRLYHKTYEVGEDRTLLSDMEELMKYFKIERIIPDDCPAGQYLIRVMREKGWNVQPMAFVTDKVKKYGAFRAKVNRGKVKSYPDPDLKTEMLALEQREGTRTSMIDHAPGYRDDLIDSFLMSAYFYTDTEDDFNFYSFDDIEESKYDKKKTTSGYF